MHTAKPIRRKESEDGYMLLAVIFMLALLTISMSVAIPEIAKSIQRDREVETMHRGKQYIRAIQLYYRKFGSYPPSVDALVKTNNIRFLRKRYLDPMTGKDDWKAIYFGQNKEPLAMGFFGQPLAGMGGATPVAGVGPSGGNGMPGAGMGQPGGAFGSSTGGGMSSSPGGSSLFGSSSNTGANLNPTAGNGTPGVSGSGSSNSGNATANAGDSGSTSGSSGSGFMSGQTGQSFGGAGIVGFRPASSKKSILLYKKKDHYNQWEFTYSPMMDMKQQSTAGNLIGVQPSTPTTPSGSGAGPSTGGPGSSFGGGTSFGSGPGGGSSPSPTPAPPQQ